MSASKMVLGVLGFCGVFGLNAIAQGGASTPQSRANELQSRYMTTVKAELTSKLDAKTAAPGQVLTAKTSAAVTLADGTAIPAGTKLVGRVLEVHARTEERTESVVTVTFDRAEMKDGKALPVRSMIRGVSMAGAAAPPAMAAGDPSAGSRGRSGGPIGVGGVGSDPAGTGGMGGDPMGGLGGEPSMGGTAGSRNGGMGGSGTSGGSTTRGGRQIPQQSAARVPMPDTAPSSPVASTAEGGETVRISPKPTGLPGLLLYANPASDVSGTLMEYDKNIHLDNGVLLTLGLISRQAAADSGGAK